MRKGGEGEGGEKRRMEEGYRKEEREGKSPNEHTRTLLYFVSGNDHTKVCHCCQLTTSGRSCLFGILM